MHFSKPVSIVFKKKSFSKWVSKFLKNKSLTACTIFETGFYFLFYISNHLQFDYIS
ncbi:hypothetical protein CNEO3_550001 [Clostridium neonatale]|nr:hypothetical protein CNEO3_550001 [Clostridium neonatale]